MHEIYNEELINEINTKIADTGYSTMEDFEEREEQ